MLVLYFIEMKFFIVIGVLHKQTVRVKLDSLSSLSVVYKWYRNECSQNGASQNFRPRSQMSKRAKLAQSFKIWSTFPAQSQHCTICIYHLPSTKTVAVYIYSRFCQWNLLLTCLHRSSVQRLLSGTLIETNRAVILEQKNLQIMNLNNLFRLTEASLSELKSRQSCSKYVQRDEHKI